MYLNAWLLGGLEQKKGGEGTVYRSLEIINYSRYYSNRTFVGDSYAS
jgi:hypothetical protein